MSDKPYYTNQRDASHLRAWILARCCRVRARRRCSWSGIGVFLYAIYGVGLLLPEESKQAPPPRKAGAIEAPLGRRTSPDRNGRPAQGRPSPFGPHRRPDPGAAHGPVPFLLATGDWVPCSTAARHPFFPDRRPTDDPPRTPILDRIAGPADLKALTDADLARLADEVRAEVISAVSETGGHLGSRWGWWS